MHCMNDAHSRLRGPCLTPITFLVASTYFALFSVFQVTLSSKIGVCCTSGAYLDMMLEA